MYVMIGLYESLLLRGWNRISIVTASLSSRAFNPSPRCDRLPVASAAHEVLDLNGARVALRGSWLDNYLSVTSLAPYTVPPRRPNGS